MPQVIQIHRHIGGAAAVPTGLQAGELALSGPDATLYAGVDAGGTVTPLVHPARQLEIHGASPAQTILGGIKTVDIARLRITGGAAGEVLSAVNAAGDLDFIPAAAATQTFVGQFNATTGVITWVAGFGPGNALPGAAVGNAGQYLICSVAGSNVDATFPSAGPYHQGDWVLSSGTAWTFLDFGGTTVSTADQIGTVAPLTGPTVQDELVALQADKVDMAGDTMTGLLVLSGPPVAPLGAVTKTYADLKVAGIATSTVGGIMTFADATGKQAADSTVLITDLATAADLALKADITYVDSENDAQDIIINGKADTTYVDAQNALDVKIAGGAGAIMTGLLTLSGAPTANLHAATKLYVDAKGDVFGPAVSVLDRVAVFGDVTGKLIADGGLTIAEIISSVPGAAPPLVTAPELVGDGTTGNAITFTGITIAANSALELFGNGLSTSGLDLRLVDGGTF
jgi:hypothetical protein